MEYTLDLPRVEVAEQTSAFSGHQSKDVDAATAQATAVGLRLPILEVVTQLYSRMKTGEHTELDHSALYLLLNDLAGGRGDSLDTQMQSASGGA